MASEIKNLKHGEIVLDIQDKGNWLATISKCKQDNKNFEKKEFSIVIRNCDNINDFEPFHIVTLACLVDFLFNEGFENCRFIADNDIVNYLKDGLKLDEYWQNKTISHIKSNIETIFNLWHISENEKELYCDKVYEYLKRNFFNNKDLSAVKNSLIEIYYNIFDHAKANGNCFSFIKFDERTSRLYVAVCDFGIGVAKSIRNYYKEINDDIDALNKATKYGVTTYSTERNRGFGIDNIISHIQDDDTLRIVSNSAIYFHAGGKVRLCELPFDFQGTIIYYDISLNNFEDEEKCDNFEIDFEL